MSKKVIFYSFSFSKGGAGIAAAKFVKMAASLRGTDSVQCIDQSDAGSIHYIKRIISHILANIIGGANIGKQSLNLFTAKNVLRSFQNNTKAIHHIHWINNDTLSIFDLKKLPKNTIFTLHDEWLYSGTEHHCLSENNLFGYNNKHSRFSFSQALNKQVWKIKKNILKHRDDIIFTVPSKWMLERVKNSLTLNGKRVRYLPNPIDTDTFKPLPKNRIHEFRQKHGVGENDFLIVFGAVGGKGSEIKGGDYLKEALNKLMDSSDIKTQNRLKLIDFGSHHSKAEHWGNVSSKSLGYIDGKEQLNLIYASADCVVIPSIREAFGQVAAEAAASGSIAVCFNTSGLKDIIIDGQTGFLAQSMNSDNLKETIEKVIALPQAQKDEIRTNARTHIVTSFSNKVVIDSYAKILKEAENI